MRRIYKALTEKIQEALASVIPITLIVLVLSATVTPMPTGTMLMFLAGAVMLVVGMGLFSLGADIAMMPMGEALGRTFTRTKNILFIVLAFFVMGVMVTVAEPDLSVLAQQVPSIPNAVLIWTVAVGVGLFLVTAVLRTLFRIPLRRLLLVFYIFVLILSFFVPENMVAVAFDSGGVTTGPITVPFIMALGLGMAATRSDVDSDDDSFGIVALCSVGPIMAVLLLGIIYHPEEALSEVGVMEEVATTGEMFAAFGHGLPHYLEEVLLALAPILAVFVLYQLFTHAFHRRQLGRICVGLVYTLVGLVLFLTGVNVGFMPVGQYIGDAVATSAFPWLLIFLGALMGWFIVQAEPAVHVLTRQVEEVTGGAVSRTAMLRALSVGMAVSIALSMCRILLHIPLYFIIIPGYAVALGLSFVVKPIFTGIAFDSGGVASGPMTATFLLPFAMGACSGVGGNMMLDAFGVVSLVAMTPLITIQIMGLVYKLRTAHHEKKLEALGDVILEYDVAGMYSDSAEEAV